MVSRPGRHTHERDVVLHRDPGDEGLRAVPAGHPDHVGRAGGLPCQRQQIVTRPEQHRVDTSPLRLQDELEPLHLPTAGSGIHQEHRLLGPPDRSSRRQLLPPRPADGVAGRHDKHDTRHQENDKLVDRAADDHRHRTADQRGDRKTSSDESDRPMTRERDPTERGCDTHRREHEQQRHHVPHHQRNECHDHTGGRQQRQPRGEARHPADRELSRPHHVDHRGRLSTPRRFDPLPEGSAELVDQRSKRLILPLRRLKRGRHT